MSMGSGAQGLFLVVSRPRTEALSVLAVSWDWASLLEAAYTPSHASHVALPHMSPFYTLHFSDFFCCIS